MTGWREFWILGESASLELRDTIERLIREWCLEWSLNDVELISAERVRDYTVNEGLVTAARAGDGRLCEFSVESGLIGIVSTVIFGAQQDPGTIAWGVAQSAANDLAGRLLGEAVSTIEISNCRGDVEEGQIGFKVCINSSQFLVAMSKGAARSLVTERKWPDVGALANRRESLRGEPVAIEVQIRSERIALSDLATLREGDVLVLEKNIDTPCDISINDRVIGQGVLGRVAERIAIRIAEIQG